jgi:hypothetical protein
MPYDSLGRWQPRRPHLLVCRECARTVDAAQWVNAKHLLRARLCNDCLKWVELLKIANDPNTVRAGGVHYVVHPGEPEAFRGEEPRHYRIRFHDGRELLTANLWCQGVIPARFRSRLPDNATLCDA